MNSVRTASSVVWLPFKRVRTFIRMTLCLLLLLASAAICSPLLHAQSMWDKIKQAAKQAEQQGRQPAQTGQQQRPGQPPAKPGRQEHADHEQGGSGPIKPPPGTKVEERVMAPLADGAKFFVSPHGVHIATAQNSGSRAVIYYDGGRDPNSTKSLEETVRRWFRLPSVPTASDTHIAAAPATRWS